MISEVSLFDEIMSLSTTEIPYRKMRSQKKNSKRRHKNTSTTELDSLYQDLINEGSRLDITLERRVEIRKELTLIRKQKRLMDKAMRKNRYS